VSFAGPAGAAPLDDGAGDAPPDDGAGAADAPPDDGGEDDAGVVLPLHDARAINIMAQIKIATTLRFFIFCLLVFFMFSLFSCSGKPIPLCFLPPRTELTVRAEAKAEHDF